MEGGNKYAESSALTKLRHAATVMSAAGEKREGKVRKGKVVGNGSEEKEGREGREGRARRADEKEEARASRKRKRGREGRRGAEDRPDFRPDVVSFPYSKGPRLMQLLVVLVPEEEEEGGEESEENSGNNVNRKPRALLRVFKRPREEEPELTLALPFGLGEGGGEARSVNVSLTNGLVLVDGAERVCGDAGASGGSRKEKKEKENEKNENDKEVARLRGGLVLCFLRDNEREAWLRALASLRSFETYTYTATAENKNLT